MEGKEGGEEREEGEEQGKERWEEALPGSCLGSHTPATGASCPAQRDGGHWADPVSGVMGLAHGGPLLGVTLVWGSFSSPGGSAGCPFLTVAQAHSPSPQLHQPLKPPTLVHPCMGSEPLPVGTWGCGWGQRAASDLEQKQDVGAARLGSGTMWARVCEPRGGRRTMCGEGGSPPPHPPFWSSPSPRPLPPQPHSALP